MGEEDELEMLLGEIPYATSRLNVNQFHLNEISKGTTCGSPVGGFSLPSDGSSSTLLSNNNDPLSPPSLEEMPFHGNSHYKANGNFGHENPIGELPLTDLVSRFCISDETDTNKFQSFNRSTPQAKYGSYAYDYCGRVLPQNHSSYPNGFQFVNHSNYGPNRLNVENFGNFNYSFPELLSPDLNGFQFGDCSAYGANNINEGTKMNAEFNWRGVSSYGMPQYSGLRSPHGLDGETRSAFSGPFSGMNYPSNPYTCFDYSMNHPYVGSALLGGQLNRINMNEERGSMIMYNRSPNSKASSNSRGLQRGFGVSSTGENSLTVRGDRFSSVEQKKFGRSGACNLKGSNPTFDNGLEDPKGRRVNPRVCNSLIPPPTYKSLAEVRGYIHIIAKDQDGCRFLQRVIDDGTPEDMHNVFGEIIGHVVELMVDPFGNYLMQKLLEVCNEEHRMQILLMLTEKPGQLIRISLNTHGTRVVQKLIETLKTRQQVSLVISALEPGFLALIKDLNGNHVIKQCLQSLSHEDNKFIFAAASKYCVEVATHQHGCCVLQCCVSLLTGKHRENLVKEISSSGILLAQDEYGNFVIQFILDLEIPSAKSSLISQFEGNFVHLSTQKFSSHVVEKCLAVLDNDTCSKIVQELLSAPHFKQLLQDPYANYVIGKALKVSEGSCTFNVLAEAIQSHESILRNCPYSKKIVSALRQYRETTTCRKSPSPRSS